MNANEYARVENGRVVGEAMMYMRSRPPNPDGTIGFMALQHTPEFDAWLDYFEANGMRVRASMMRVYGANGYVVPCRDPRSFDPTFTRELRPRHAARQLTPGERDALVEKVKGALGYKPVRTARYRADDPRGPKASPPEVMPLTGEYADDLKRLMERAA